MDSEDSNGTDVQRQLSAPMPCIGLYVAAASLICTLQMAADVFFGLRIKKYWFPSRYFSLNATSLTLLAVAMKLPVDLTTRMYTVTDRLAKVSSLAFMSASMANLLTSLGSMSNQDTLSNVTALGILVITVAVNVFIQVIQLQSFLDGRLVFAEEMIVMGSMLVLLVMCGSTAVMLSFTKRYLEMKYHEMHKSALKVEEAEIWRGRVTTDKLRLLVKKYWVMEETSCPQFLIARSATCTLSGVVSLFIPIFLLEAQIRMGKDYSVLNESNSDYGWSTKWILITQTIGVIVGTIAPTSRLFIAIRYRYSTKFSNGVKSVFKVEECWTQKLVEWKQRSITCEIRHLKSRKFLHDTRGLILNLCISVQSLIVLASKLVLLISVCITSPFLSFFDFITRSKMEKSLLSDTTANSMFNIGNYVMFLEGEAELPKKTLRDICTEMDKVAQRGKTRKPQYLFKFIYRSCNFNGVIEFDCHRVPNLHSQQLPYCWSLPIVTLTSIAIALPNVKKFKRNILLNSVTEGLSYATRIDKSLDRKGVLSNIRKAADVVWVGVELHSIWKDKDLHETSVKGINSKEVLQDLSNKAERTVLEFTTDIKDSLMRNPLNWPAKVISANAMYRMSKTLLLVCDVENDETDDGLFERISVMIADILSACLINLARIITMECHRPIIEERERSVRKAALLVGETEDILALLQQREIPLLTPDQAAYIEQWRSLIKLENKHNQDSIDSGL